MASSTFSSVHAGNLALIKETQNHIADNFRHEGEDDFLNFFSVYTRSNEGATYVNHTLYSVLGFSAQGTQLPATMGVPHKFILPDGTSFNVLTYEGTASWIGIKQNGTGQPLVTDADIDTLVHGIPSFPSVEVKPRTLWCLDLTRGDQNVLSFPVLNSRMVTQICDFRTSESGETQMLVHPAEIIYQVRRLFSSLINIDDESARALALAEVQQLYTCAAVAMLTVMGTAQDGEKFQEDKFHQFRRAMRKSYINVCTVDVDIIKHFASSNGVEITFEIDTDASVWFFQSLTHDWMLMVMHLLLPVRRALGEDVSFPLSW